MSYCSHVSRVQLIAAQRDIVARIAKRHHSTLVEIHEANGAYLRWIEGPNLGHPFDGERERAISLDLIHAGILVAGKW